MEEQNDIVTRLVDQHCLLQKDLKQVSIELKKKKPDTNKIIEYFDIFLLDLSNHLALENEIFYKDLIKKMQIRGMDIVSIKVFISKMKEIETEVRRFSTKYNNKISIDQQLIDFSNEFSRLVNLLNMRIESEEDSVYLYWE